VAQVIGGDPDHLSSNYAHVSCLLYLSVEFLAKGRDGGGMGMNKCIAVRKNDPVETYFSMTTMPLDGMNFQLE
jgi:hypothetical protein